MFHQKKSHETLRAPKAGQMMDISHWKVDDLWDGLAGNRGYVILRGNFLVIDIFFLGPQTPKPSVPTVIFRRSSWVENNDSFSGVWGTLEHLESSI